MRWWENFDKSLMINRPLNRRAVRADLYHHHQQHRHDHPQRWIPAEYQPLPHAPTAQATPPRATRPQGVPCPAATEAHTPSPRSQPVRPSTTLTAHADSIPPNAPRPSPRPWRQTSSTKLTHTASISPGSRANSANSPPAQSPLTTSHPPAPLPLR